MPEPTPNPDSQVTTLHETVARAAREVLALADEPATFAAVLEAECEAPGRPA